MKITDKNTVLAWATARCAQRECCRSEVEKKLRETPLSRAEVDEILDYLEDERYLDAARYARAFVHDKSEYDRWGRIKIAQALRLKGFDRATIDEALAARIDADRYREILTELLRAKVRTLHFDAADREAAYKNSQKLVRFAASRGFEPELIFDVVEQLTDH